MKCLFAGYRYQPLRFDPGIQCPGIEVRSTDEFLGFHHHTPIDCRGLHSTGCHPATNASSFGSGFSGSISISLTYSSPLLPSARGTPRLSAAERGRYLTILAPPPRLLGRGWGPEPWRPAPPPSAISAGPDRCRRLCVREVAFQSLTRI